MTNNRSLIYGIGVNDSPVPVYTYTNKKQSCCPIYERWKAMLRRCYASTNRDPSYKGCTVCNEWLTFSNFRAWIETQDWQNKHLDKDLLVDDNKVYSPETCVFVSQELNNLLNDRAAKRGAHPIGVSWHKQDRKFEAQCNIQGKSQYLGRFATEQGASEAYQAFKKQLFYDLAMQQTDSRIKEALLRRSR